MRCCPAVAALLTAPLLAACSSPGGAFTCGTSSQCNLTEGGYCVPSTSYCAYPSMNCTSGYRYASNAGSLASACAPAPPKIDAGVADTGADAAFPDAALADARSPDASPPDQARPDVARPDMRFPDMRPPDATPPDIPRPDASPPDSPPSGPVTLYTSAGQIWGIAADSTNVYWTNVVRSLTSPAPVGAVLQMPSGGGTIATLATPSQPQQIAVYGGSVVYSDLSTRTLARVPVGGGVAPTVLTSTDDVTGMIIDSTGIYYTDNKSSVGNAAVLEEPLSGGVAPRTVAGPLYYPIHIVEQGTLLYWTDQNGDLYDVAASGGTAAALYTTLGANAGGLAVDSTSLYWLTSAGDLMKAPLGGGAPTTLYSGASATIGSGIAVDSTNAYLANTTGVYAVSLASATPSVTTLYSGSAQLLVTGPTSLYWASGPNLLRGPK